MKKVVGIDISSGARSSLGFAVVDMTSLQILHTNDFKPAATPDLRKRIKQIAAFLATEFKKLEAEEEDYIIIIESTVMQGIGGQSLQRAIGAAMLVCPAPRRLEFVYPMSVKKHVTGVGKGSDKKAIADGLKRVFSDKHSLELIWNLTASSRWDMLDAVAIALTGWELHVEKSKIVPNIKSRKTKQKGLVKP
jgi:Holliday junction resolvasome RuvABC endonuclease subunit